MKVFFSLTVIGLVFCLIWRQSHGLTCPHRKTTDILQSITQLKVSPQSTVKTHKTSQSPMQTQTSSVKPTSQTTSLTNKTSPVNKTTSQMTHPATTKGTTNKVTPPPTTKKTTHRVTHPPTTKNTTHRVTHPPTTKKTTHRVTHPPTTKKTTHRVTHPPTTKKTTHRVTHPPTAKKTTHRVTHPPTTKKTTHRVTHQPTTKKTTHRVTHTPTTKKTTHRVTHPPTTNKTTHRVTHPTSTKKTTHRVTHPPTTKKTTHRVTHPPTTKKTTHRVTHPPTNKKTTHRVTHPPTTKKTTHRVTHPPTTKKTTHRVTHPPTTKKTTHRVTHPHTTKKTTHRVTHPPTTKKTTHRVTHPPTTKKTTQRVTHPPTTKKTTRRVTHPRTTKKTTHRVTHPPTTKKTTHKVTHPPTTKKTTHRVTHPPTTKKTTHRVTHHPSTKKTTHRVTHPPTTKKTTHRVTHPPTTKKTTHRVTHPPTTKKTTHRVTRPPTTKKTTHRVTNPPTSKKTTHRVTHPPTTKKTTHRVTPPPTTKKTTHRVTHPPTAKKTTHRVTHPPTTKKTTHRVTHPPTTKKTTHRVTHPPTTKKTTHRVTHPPTAKKTTHRVTHPPTTKKTTHRVTHPPTTKKTTHRVTHPPTTKKTTHRVTHPPTAKKTTHRVTHPPTTKKTTHRVTHPPTTKKTTHRVTHPPTTKKTSHRVTHPPTTKKTTHRVTHLPTTKKTSHRVTHPPTTKKTTHRVTHPPTTKNKTHRVTHPPTTKKTTHRVTHPPTTKKTTQRVTHPPATRKATTNKLAVMRAKRALLDFPVVWENMSVGYDELSSAGGNMPIGDENAPITREDKSMLDYQVAGEDRPVVYKHHAGSGENIPEAGEQITKSGEDMPVAGEYLAGSGGNMSLIEDRPVVYKHHEGSGENMPEEGEHITASGEDVPMAGEYLAGSGKNMPVIDEHFARSGENMPEIDEYLAGSGQNMPLIGQLFARSGRNMTVDYKNLSKAGEEMTELEDLSMSTEGIPVEVEDFIGSGTDMPMAHENFEKTGDIMPAVGEDYPMPEDDMPMPYEDFPVVTQETPVETEDLMGSGSDMPMVDDNFGVDGVEDYYPVAGDKSMTEDEPVVAEELPVVVEDVAELADDMPAVVATQRSFPDVPDNYQVEVEANIIDKGYTVDAKIFYDYIGNQAAISTNGKDSFSDWSKYIYSYATNEVFKISNGQEMDCAVEKITTSTNIYSTWLFGYMYTDNGLHISYPTMQIGFQDETDYEAEYLGNGTVRGIPVDHWQGCGRWETNSTMLIDYYFAQSWNTAGSFPRVPVRTEVLADKQLPNGSMYSLHHIYDYYNFQPYLDDDLSIFETPKGVVCPGRKNTKPVPALPQSFYYRVEIINPAEELISYEDIWYDDYYRHYRKDYRPLLPQYPTFSTNPLTEIHDYHIGVRYIIDKFLGNCSILPLTNTSGEATPKLNSEKAVDSYMLNLKNPLQLFNLGWNYTYIGQSWERGILCDVYVTERQNLFVSGFQTNIATSITVYFLSKDWINYVNEGPDYVWQTPVKMELNAEDIAFSAIYNYLDFSADRPFLSAYDISPCFSENDKLKFQVKFPGTYQKTSDATIKNEAHSEFACIMGVNILRVQELGLEYDDQYLYISATLLDNPPPPALFEYVPGKVAKKEDDSIVFNVMVPMQCANYCVNPTEKDFVCNSYDFCSNVVGNDFTYECRLSRAHTSDGIILSNSSTCDHFSRSVNGEPAEPSIMDAFHKLRMAVYFNKTLTLILADPILGPFFVPDPDSEFASYTAVDVSVTYGWITSNVELPKLPDYLHYRIEATIPAIKYSFEAEENYFHDSVCFPRSHSPSVAANSAGSGTVWYDKTMDLIRLDSHYNKRVDPYYTTNPITIIDDFSTGLQYIVDRVQKNCTIQAIPETDFGAVLNHSLPYTQNSTWSLRIKTPYELLRIDNTYQFVGQKTVRGLLCNVFESLRLDYKVPNLEGNYRSVFRFFFLADGWYEVSEETSGASSQPVRLEVTVMEIGIFLEFDFYDFNMDRPDISTYDIHQCFNASKQNTFQITFPGPVHPFMDTQSKLFRTDVIFAMSQLTGLSPLRFQRTRVDYDSNIYVTTTLIGQAEVIKYFTHVTGGGVVKKPDAVYDNVQSLESCAQACYSDVQSFVCNSFYYCSVNSARQCRLSNQNVPDNPDSSNDSGCESYSRTVTSRDLPPPIGAELFMQLKNFIYRGKLQVQVLVPSSLQSHIYTASEVRTDIFTPLVTANNLKASLQHFAIVSSNTRALDFDSLYENLSVDDCAQACLDTTRFQCQGFSYCDPSLNCMMLKTRPNNMTSQRTTTSAFCYMYQRTYLDDYSSSPGSVFMTSADYSDWPIASADVCAKKCSQQNEFQCKSFEYCQSTKECLMFAGRTVGIPMSDSVTSCSYYTRNYLIDFKAELSSSYMFTSDVQFIQVSASQCARLCVEQQGTSCHGFYYCEVKLWCHLMFAQSQTHGASVDANPNNPDILCNYYRRTDTGLATTSSSAVTSVSSSTRAVLLTTLSSSSSSPTTTTQSSSTSTTPLPIIETFRPPQYTLGQPRTTMSSSRSKGTTTINVLPTALHQTGGDNNSKNNAGTVVGVAFATFIIGLVVGAAAFYFLQEQPILRTVRHFFSIRKRRQSYTTDQDTHRDIEMNFKPLEETC